MGIITIPYSLQITPACNLPLKSLSGGGKIVIVNLQVFCLCSKYLQKTLRSLNLYLFSLTQIKVETETETVWLMHEEYALSDAS